MKKELKDLKAGRGSAELEERVREAEQQARDAKAREAEAVKRVDELSEKLAEAIGATISDNHNETLELLQTENKELKSIGDERASAVSRLEQDNAQLRQDAAATQVKIGQLERRVAELQKAEQKLEREAEELKLAAKSHPEAAPGGPASEVVQELERRIAELEARLAKSEEDVQIGKNRVDALDKSLLEEQKKGAARSLEEREKAAVQDKKYEDKEEELKMLLVEYRKLEGDQGRLRNELKLKAMQCSDAHAAVERLEQQLRGVQTTANVDGTSADPAPAPEPMDIDMIDGPPELPSPPSSPVTGPTEVREVRERNRRLSQHNITLRTGQTKLEQEVQNLRAEVERLETENTLYEPFVLTSEQRDRELEALTEENALLCRSNERVRGEVEELRTLRDRGLLQDLKSATPDGLVPSSELTGMLGKNLTDVFAGIDAVLAETAQRKFTIVDRTQPATSSLSRRQSMVFKQATRPSTPAFAHVCILFIFLRSRTDP